MSRAGDEVFTPAERRRRYWTQDEKRRILGGGPRRGGVGGDGRAATWLQRQSSVHMASSARRSRISLAEGSGADRAGDDRDGGLALSSAGDVGIDIINPEPIEFIGLLRFACNDGGRRTRSSFDCRRYYLYRAGQHRTLALTC